MVLLRRRGAALRLQRWGAALWLFSPLTATISTRGNGEALVTCMLLGLLLALDAGGLGLGGAVAGGWQTSGCWPRWPAAEGGTRRPVHACSLPS